MKKFHIGAADLALLLLTAALLLGVLTLFRPCAAREDGSWMSCHWAGTAVAGAAGTMLLLSAVRLFLRRETKTGLSIAMIPLAALAFLLPGGLISLCMMRDMRCHELMTPCVRVLAVLIALTALLDVLFARKKEKNHEA